MIRERVSTSTRAYDIVIGADILQTLGELLRGCEVSVSSRHLLITDENVQATGLADIALEALTASGYQTTVHTIPAGEASKTLAHAETALRAAYQAGLDRRSVILALGGGVVGDLAGFVAATYMRGIDFVQLPTTLLAHDSAVGGKVAVNLPEAKNVIGAFHQPLCVLYDTQTLRSLPLREMRSGLAEAIKHGVIRDAALFRWIGHSLDALLERDDAALAELLARSCRIKAAIVSADERETGERALLNFGHTLGHAVESLARYGTFTHGDAVAIGMAAAADLSVALGLMARTDADEIIALLSRAGLPVRIPRDLPAGELIAAMRQDKKAVGGSLTFVLCREIGQAEVVRRVDEAVICQVIEDRREPS
ncbi:3-dehydroquinate synthase [Tumebacillus sp. DT12]|uniref:3-dehydroquinate synthase n=1 Tax=Tumebacillus lacus TaxID=2995335 RepID=A0ABT3X0U8_9BACL|nr:3-dehydroquinate synthase [Tumebacillus lacus]MCX7569392.1 3-dehydroquinate synthase [Tumebacillus lacus]